MFVVSPPDRSSRVMVRVEFGEGEMAARAREKIIPVRSTGKASKRRY